jgi:hypothetical protein
MKANPEFKEIEISDEWFKVYQIKPDLFIFSEPYHFEQALSSLLVGKEKAMVIRITCLSPDSSQYFERFKQRLQNTLLYSKMTKCSKKNEFFV